MFILKFIYFKIVGSTRVDIKDRNFYYKMFNYTIGTVPRRSRPRLTLFGSLMLPHLCNLYTWPNLLTTRSAIIKRERFEHFRSKQSRTFQIKTSIKTKYNNNKVRGTQTWFEIKFSIKRRIFCYANYLNVSIF